MYVAELPPKYNLHTIVEEGCTEGRHLERLLSNPLGTLLSESLDSALYRCATPKRRPLWRNAALGSAPLLFCLPAAGVKELSECRVWAQELFCAQPGGAHAHANALLAAACAHR